MEPSERELELIERAITMLVALRSNSELAYGTQWRMVQLVRHLNQRRDFIDPTFSAAAQYFLDLLDPGVGERQLRDSVKAFVAGAAFGAAAGILASEDRDLL